MVSSGPQHNHMESPAQSNHSGPEASHGSKNNAQAPRYLSDLALATPWSWRLLDPMPPPFGSPWWLAKSISFSLAPAMLFSINYFIFFTTLSTVWNNILLLFSCLFTWLYLTKICKRTTSCSLVSKCLVEWKPETLADTLLFLLRSIISHGLSSCLCF